MVKTETTQDDIVFGEVFIGVDGRLVPVIQVVHEVTGVDKDDCRDDTKYNFLFDMCRNKLTRGDKILKDRNFAYATQLQQDGLAQRICQINSAQLGFKATDSDSLVQRLAKVLETQNKTCWPMKRFGMFNSEKQEQLVDIKFPSLVSDQFDFHDMTFPMGGHCKENTHRVGHVNNKTSR